MLSNLHASPLLLAPLAAGVLLLGILFAAGKVPLSYNVRNLVVRWPITLLTVLAFIMVIGLMTVMLAFVNGMYRLTVDSGVPGNVIVFSDGATDELFSNLNYSDTSDVERHALVLKDENQKYLCSREVFILGSQPIPPEFKRRRFVQIRGIEDPVIAARVHNIPLVPGGKWFSEAGVQEVPGRGGSSGTEQAIQAVLGEGIAKEMGPDLGKERLEPGDVFELGPRKWVVVGVMAASGSTFGSEVWAKRGIVGPMYGKDQLTSIVLRTSGVDDATRLKDFLRTDFKKASLSAQTEPEYYSSLQTTNLVFLIMIGVVTFFLALGGIFGVMNTMFAAISSRIKDIGVLRILGYARWQVLVSFFLESLAIALLGGVLGCLIGYGIADGRTATSIVGNSQGGGKSIILRLVVDANILAGGLLLALFMGVLGGVLPSVKAMWVRPLESLR
jgi:hypothetical protein